MSNRETDQLEADIIETATGIQDPERFAVNLSADIADIGILVSKALFHVCNDNNDSARELLFQTYCMIYPSANLPPGQSSDVRIEQYLNDLFLNYE
jgi:hypothetical protein